MSVLRELRHVAVVLTFRIPRVRPLVCPHCGRAKWSLTRWQARFLVRNGFVRCGRDQHPMRTAPWPADTDLSHITRAAAYYTEAGQEL